jgi:hypothetical protein
VRVIDFEARLHYFDGAGMDRCLQIDRVQIPFTAQLFRRCRGRYASAAMVTKL